MSQADSTRDLEAPPAPEEAATPASVLEEDDEWHECGPATADGDHTAHTEEDDMTEANNTTHNDGDSMDDVLVAVQMNEVGASVPTPEEMQTTKAADMSSSARRKRWYYRIGGWVALCVFLFMVTALIVSAVSASKNRRSSSASSSSSAGGGSTNRDPSRSSPGADDSSSSSGTPSSSSGRKATQDEIIAFLKENGIETTHYLVTGSPQQQALQWLAEEDGANLAIPTNEHHTYHYVGRYVLAVLYYALNQGVDGGSWTEKYNWLSGQHICSWKGHPAVTNALSSPGVVCAEDNDGPPLELRLKENALRGELPTELGLLTSLQAVDLRTNFVSGTLPTELCQLSNLQTLAFSENALTGKIPACVGDKLGNLEWLFLQSNLMTGPLPTELGKLSNNLQVLLLEDNLFDGNPLGVIQSLTTLEQLFAEGNLFQGAIPTDFLVGHHKLVHLDLSHNNFTLEADFPSHLLQMVSLQSLDLSQNALDGHILPKNTTLEKKNTKLQFLSLHNNTLNGGLSSELQKLVVLEHFDISNNAFHGPLHKEFGNLTNLRYLFLSNNNFQAGSTIPTELQKLTNLVDFSMRNTNLEGPLPTWVATQLPNLVLLDLGKNNFNGTIPDKYGGSSWPNLQYLLLNGNRDLSGPVPSGLANILSLTALFLDGTGVSGDLDFLCPATVNAELIYADCEGSNKKATCTCCECCAHSSDSQGCSDPYLADLDSSLEEFFERIDYQFFDPEGAVKGGGGRRRRRRA